MESYLIGWIALFLAAISYGIYITTVLQRKTTPHSITWLVWTALNGAMFFEQMNNGAGFGAWVTGSAAIANIVIFLLSLRYGDHGVTRIDWITLVIAILMFGVWFMTGGGGLTIVLAVTIFAIGMIPTLIKSAKAPSEEPLISYALNALKFFLSLFALSVFTIETVLYPAAIATFNVVIVLYVLGVRWQHKHNKRIPLIKAKQRKSTKKRRKVA